MRLRNHSGNFKLVDPARQAGNLAGGSIPVNDPFGCCLLDSGNSIGKGGPGFFGRMLVRGFLDLFDDVLNPCFIALVPEPSYFTLSGPFKS